MSSATPDLPAPVAPAPVPPAPAAEPAGSHSQLKEWTTALIGGGIVAVTLWMAVALFLDRGSAPRWTPGLAAGVPPERFDPFSRGKDVLLLLLPLAGAVVGYYTGRVIADRAVQQATDTTRQATAAAASANTAAQTVRTTSRSTVRQALAAVEEARSPGGTRGSRAPDASRDAGEADPLDRASRRLRGLLEDLGG